MKLTGQQIARFLARPPDDIAAILLFGPDEGLVKERAAAAQRAVLGGDADDPFRLAVLEAESLRQDPARLPDEAAQLSLLGGRRVVRVRDAADGTAKPLETVLAGSPGGALVVIEAGDLAPSSSLRKLVEGAANAAAIGCYPDGPQELEQLIRDTARARGVKIADEAVEYLVDSLGGDRLVTRQEIDKLMLFAGDGGTVTLDDAVASVGDSSALVIDEVLLDAFGGAAVEATLSRLFLAGEAPVTLLRAAQRHAQRLHLAGARIAAGEPAEAALRSLRLNFRVASRFRTQLEKWPPARLAPLMARLTQAELDCKTTGYPDETICRHLFATIGRMASPRR